MTWQLGFSIGRRVGWPAERLRSLESERDRYIHLVSRPQPDAARTVSCETAQTYVQDIRERAELGEVESMRRRVAENARLRGA